MYCLLYETTSYSDGASYGHSYYNECECVVGDCLQLWKKSVDFRLEIVKWENNKFYFILNKKKPTTDDDVATDTDNHDEENEEDNGMQKCCFRPLSAMQIS